MLTTRTCTVFLSHTPGVVDGVFDDNSTDAPAAVSSTSREVAGSTTAGRRLQLAPVPCFSAAPPASPMVYSTTTALMHQPQSVPQVEKSPEAPPPADAYNSHLYLVNRVNTFPVSTAACERGFSKMNIVCSPHRTRLTVSHIAALMFISLSRPPLEKWDPMPHVKT